MTDAEIKADRAMSYGSPQQSFGRIAKLWDAYLGGREIEPKDVANMMVLLKVSRTVRATGDALKDSYQDMRVYSELAEELDV